MNSTRTGKGHEGLLFSGLYVAFHIVTVLGVIFAQAPPAYLGFFALFTYSLVVAINGNWVPLSTPLTTILLLSLLVIIARILFIGAFDIKQIAFIPHVVLAILLWHRFPSLPHRYLFRAMSGFITIYVVFFTDLGNSLTVNRTFFNAYIFILYCCAALFGRSGRDEYWDLAILFFMSVITVSRAGLVLTWILIAGLMLGSHRRRFSRLVWISASLSIVLLLNYVIFPEFMDSLRYRLLHRGFGSGRWEFWPWYVNQLDFQSAILGFDPKDLFGRLARFFFHGQELTLHNSFFQFQAYFGVVAPLLLLYCIYIATRLAKHSRWLALVMVVLLVRGSFDTILLVQRFDFVLLCIVAVLARHINRRSYPPRAAGSSSDEHR